MIDNKIKFLNTLLNNLGVFKEASISYLIYDSSYYSAKKAIREGLIKESDVYHISINLYLDNILWQKKFHAQRIISLYCHWLFFLVREGYLNEMVLNNDVFYSKIVQIAKKCYKHSEIGCFKICIDIHTEIRKELEKDIEKNKVYYNQLKKGLLLIKEEIGDNSNSEEYLKIVDLELDQFVNRHSNPKPYNSSFKFNSIRKRIIIRSY